MLQEYIKNIFNSYKRGDAREESYYSALEELIKSYIHKKGKKFDVTVLPKKTEGGNPDFRVWASRQKITGYFEAKSLNTINLDEIENSEQLKRYREIFPNLILTNFFEFRLYRNGEMVKTITIGRHFLIEKLDSLPPVENEVDFIALMEQFFSFSVSKITTAKQLAIELAKRTGFLRDQLINELKIEDNIQGIQMLEGFYKTFKDYLISSLTISQFADLFAQTITYGLFVARTRAEEKDFHRESAVKYIPHTIGILRKVFQFVSAPDLPISMKVIDDITEILAATDVGKIIHRFYHENKGTDPIIHFYETFLSHYDKKERAKRGVYYTPESVVKYIVKTVDYLLKKKFDKPDGFASNSVTVLDPAAGTLTFPAEAIKLAISGYKEKYGDGNIASLIKENILENFYAFELMMAPYAIGHLKIFLLLEKFGYRMKDDDRFKLFLTNTLEMKELAFTELPLYDAIADESQQANKIKKNKKIMVVLGNPPYSVSSSNKIEKDNEINSVYESYKELVRKEERNIQPLSDDYIKFIAFAHWKIKQAGTGIVAMITNNSYLDGIIHRDMRRKLMEDFNQIYIVNLHGSSKRQEKTPQGTKDENVFDIQQGVSIIILVKGEKLLKYIKYFDLWGLREEKYNFLTNHSIENTEFSLLSPKQPQHFFVKKDFSQQENYDKFISLKDIFNKYNAGIATGKDDVLVNFNKETLFRKLSIKDKELFKLTMEHEGVNKELIEIWWEELQAIDIEKQIKKYFYRPFDQRYMIYNNKILQRSRKIIMDNFLDNNLSIVISNTSINKYYNEVYISNELSDKHLTGYQTYVFPLFIYPIGERKELFNSKTNKTSNINWTNLPIEYQKIRSAEAVFYYIYAILYSNIYRQKYQEFLKIDFPKIPFTKNIELFKSISSIGENLSNLHLLKTPELNNPTSKFIGQGDNVVKEIKYTDERLYINSEQYFTPVASNIYNYYIGGYKVLNKWLKDRKSRTLSLEEVRRFCQVITSLKLTIEIQERIDKFYPEVEKILM